MVETLEDQKAMDQKKKKEEDDEKRSRNIIIKGVPEQLNEKMYLTMTELINILGCTFPYSLTNGGFRIGKLSNVKKSGDSYPRNIKLRLQTTQQKSEMFGLKDNLKKSMKFEKVIFANDLSSDDLLTYKEVQTLYNTTKCIGGVTSMMKGSAIIINGVTYRKDNFASLPLGLTLENASTVMTAKGTLFQGHCTPLSNFYPCDIRDGEGRTATSVEHLFAMTMAEVCQVDLPTRKLIRAETNPYVIRQHMRKIKKNDKWINMSMQVLRDIVELKFTSVPGLMDKLQGYKSDVFFEATRDPKYGCGYFLSQASEITKANVPDSANLMGKILAKSGTSTSPTHPESE